jgi:hypothetical protein
MSGVVGEGAPELRAVPLRMGPGAGTHYARLRRRDKEETPTIGLPGRRLAICGRCPPIELAQPLFLVGVLRRGNVVGS